MSEDSRKRSARFWATAIVASSLFVPDAWADAYGEMNPESATETALVVDEVDYRGGPSRIWAISAFDSIFGVLEYGPLGSHVHIGPFEFRTRLSAPAVASIAAVGLVVLVGLAVLAITKARGKSAPP